MAHTILVVEDHPVMQRTYRMLFESEPDLEICGIATTAAEALEQAEKFNPDIMLLDMSLPDGDGLGLIPVMRGRFPRTKIIVASGFQASRYARKAINEGACDYIDKAEAFETCLASIRRCLAPV